MIYTSENCSRGMYDKAPTETSDNAGCIAILKPETLKPEYRNSEFQLFLLEGGFGCIPSAIGNACIGIFCKDGEKCRFERFQFIGIANAETAKIGWELLAKLNNL